VVIDPTLSRDGLTFITYAGGGEITGAEVAFRTDGVVGDGSVAGHELLHVLGFGHAAAWPSLMGISGPRLARATPEDVAYALVLYLVREAQGRHHATYGLAEGAAGERVESAAGRVGGTRR
jgi:hypothetical protein